MEETMKMARRKQVALMVDDELLGALRNSMAKSGRKMGPEAAWCLKRFFRIGPFARKEVHK